MLGEVLTAIVTPFREDGSVDLDAFRRLAAHLVDNGSDGIVVTGTTGESPTLTDEERLDLYAAAVEEIGDRATVVAGTGTYSTAHSIHLTEQAHELGVDGFLVVTPYYNRPPQAGIVEHFRAIAAVTDKPVVAYNIPGRVVVNIEPETFEQLAQIANVTAVKQAYDDLEHARRIVELGFDLYAGDDPLTRPFVELGGTGVVSVTAHIVGSQLKRLVRAAREGNGDAAGEVERELAPAFDLLKVAINPIPIKAALRLLGHDVGGHRMPLVEPTEAELDAVRSCLERLRLLEPARV